jgi:hypothetical protein
MEIFGQISTEPAGGNRIIMNLGWDIPIISQLAFFLHELFINLW